MGIVCIDCVLFTRCSPYAGEDDKIARTFFTSSVVGVDMIDIKSLSRPIFTKWVFSACLLLIYSEVTGPMGEGRKR